MGAGTAIAALELSPHDVDYEVNVDQLPTPLGWRASGANNGLILDPEFAT